MARSRSADTAQNVVVFTPWPELDSRWRPCPLRQRHAPGAAGMPHVGAALDHGDRDLDRLPGAPFNRGLPDGPAPSVVTDAAAHTGGHQLAQFVRGLDAARETDAHITALGHSYGSTTTAAAALELAREGPPHRRPRPVRVAGDPDQWPSPRSV